MKMEDALTPSEFRHAALVADLKERREMLERVMTQMDAMVYNNEQLSLDALDECVGTIAAAINGIAALVHAQLEERGDEE